MRLVRPSSCTFLLTFLALSGCVKGGDGGDEPSTPDVSDQDNDGFSVEDGDCDDCDDTDSSLNLDDADSDGYSTGDWLVGRERGPFLHLWCEELWRRGVLGD